MKKQKLYINFNFLLVIMTFIIIVSIFKISKNIKILTITIQILLILYLLKITYECILYVRKQFVKQKYSYSIIINLGLTIFFVVNILRQINLLISDWNVVTIKNIYLNAIESFSYFAMVVLPFIIILASYSIITNVFLIKREGCKFQNFLGICFGFFIIASVCSWQSIYIFLKTINLTDAMLIFKRFVEISLNSILCYFYCLILATLYCNIMAANHRPKPDKDFVIVLGSKIKGDGTLTPLLKGRVDKAIDFGKNQKEKTNKDIIYIPSGGKGNDEIISEAEAMKKYLIEQGVKSENVIIENKASNTLENMKFSKNIIDEINKNAKIVFSTTNYHVFRSGIIANDEGIECEGMGSKTKWYFYTNAVIREFIANLVVQKKQHLLFISLMNSVLFALILFGYFNNYLF